MSTKIKMSCPVRLMLLDLLAQEQGRRSRLKLLRILQEELSMDKKEGELVGLTETDLGNGRMASRMTTPQNDPMKEIEVGEVYLEIICNKLKELETGEQLRQDQIELYDTFEPEIDRLTGSDKKEDKK
ncbi:MAG TPA: hypothetical protein VMV77_16775 [Bacteroidales bacterium]|nr:hypothetical protein [Bacteroidales bacterium]